VKGLGLAKLCHCAEASRSDAREPGARRQPSNQRPEEAASTRTVGSAPWRSLQCLRTFSSTGANALRTSRGVRSARKWYRSASTGPRRPKARWTARATGTLAAAAPSGHGAEVEGELSRSRGHEAIVTSSCVRCGHCVRLDLRDVPSCHDNGTPFVAPRGLHGLTQLCVWWIRLGIHPCAPSPPIPNGTGQTSASTAS
jgi:hypothetical protein